MGGSHSKADKSSVKIINEKALLSPRLKLKSDSNKKKPKKFSLVKKKSKLEDLQESRPQMNLDPNELQGGIDWEAQIKRRMQDQLAFNSDIFVLNQMMMSVQFFANYERFARP